MTGWNLPPGVTNKMIDDAFGGDYIPTELQENVLKLLEEAKIPQSTCDAIMEMIAEAEQQMGKPDPDEMRDNRADWELDKDR